MDTKETLPNGNTRVIPGDDDKPLTHLVRSLISDFNLSIQDVAGALNISVQSFRNKIYRNSFSIDDLLIVTDLCGCSIQIHKPSGDDFTFDLKTFLDAKSYGDYQTYTEEKRIARIEDLKATMDSLSPEDKEKLLSEIGAK